MKLTFCTYDSPWIHGGPMSWSTRFLPALKEKGYEIEIIFFTEGNLEECKFLNFFKSEGFKTYTYPHVSFSYFKIRWILKLLSQSTPDIFIPNAFVHAFFASHWLKKARIPSVGILHSDDEFHYGVIDEFITGQEKYRLTDIVAVSKQLENKILDLGANPAHTACIPYGSPTHIVKTSFDDSKTKLLYLGRFSEWQKRIGETTHALCKAVLAIENIEVNLFGAGETDLVQDIINSYKVNDKVKIHGLLNPDEVQLEMIKHDVFVLLSDFEGIPIALMEAMAVGLVPICKNIESGIPELVTNGENGILVNDRDREFIEAVKLIHIDKELRKKMSANARQTILEGFSSKLSIEQWDQFLKKIKNNAPKKNAIRIPLFFILPIVNRKLLREDFRLLDYRSNYNKYIYRPIRTKLVDLAAFLKLTTFLKSLKKRSIN